MRIVFMGTPEFAVAPLKALIDNGETIVGVITMPDKPVGRKAVLTEPPVKSFAKSKGIPVFQPVSLKNGAGVEILKELSPELAVVIAYGKILPDDFLEFPKYGCINIHGSALPKYRGAAPIQRSVINGDKYAGITSIQMDSGVDTGDMLVKKEILIGENETSGELYERLSPLGAEVLIETLEQIKNGTLSPVKQNDSESTHAAMLDKSMSPVDFSKTAFEVHKQICGLDPWPTATTTLDGKSLKLYKSYVLSDISDESVGTPRVVKDGLSVVCGDKKSVIITEVQYEGKKRMSAVDFLRGHKLPDNMII